MTTAAVPDNIRFLESQPHAMPLFLEFGLLGLFMFGLFATFRYLVRRAAGNKSYKSGVAVALLSAFLLFWVNGAVGIIGSENNDANMLYFALLVVVLAGSLVVRFEASRLRFVMGFAACAMVLIAFFALGFGMGVSGPIWPWDVVWITLFFSGLWSLSSWFFHRALQEVARAEDRSPLNEGGAL